MAATDPFGTAEIRGAALASWGRSTARFREDANAEESLALVGYADRVVVELAANASDAALAAGVAGRIRFSVLDNELRVANTGAPVSATGVVALSSLRASAKRDLTSGVGHFGVGFTAVLAITDRPQIHSTTGSIEFSRTRTLAAVHALDSAELASEVDLRHEQVPILRLPWAVPAEPVPDGFQTEIRLPLRAGIDPDLVLSSVGDYLLLTLPGLDVIEMPGRILSRELQGPDSMVITDNGVSTRWQLSRRSGELPSDLLALQPVEERGRRSWWITWAAPVGRGSTGRDVMEDVLYAPTPTDERLQLPARLIGSFPVDDTRRHVAAGGLADFMVAEAVAGYLDLLRSTESSDRLALIPGAGFGVSALDTGLRMEILDQARSTPLLLAISGSVIAGRDAVILPGVTDDLAELVSEAVPNLLPVPDSAAAVEVLRTLGVRTLETAQMSGALGSLGRGPEFWGRLYELLGYASTDDLADLPVPLADGRTVLGGRGVLIPDFADSDATDELRDLVAALPTLRLVDPAAVTTSAARELLQRLGATPADPTAILADHAVAAQIAALREDLDLDESSEHFEPLAHAVLQLIARGGRPAPGSLDDLVLINEDGEPWPATQLLLPGSEWSAILDPDADIPAVATTLVDRFGHDVLVSAGVIAGFRIVRDEQATGPDHDLPDEDLWWDEVVAERIPASFSAIADFDLIDPDRWPQALRLLTADRAAMDTLVSAPGDPTPYSRWWLANFAVLGGRPPQDWRLSTAVDLVGLFDELPVALAAEFPIELLSLIGVRVSLAQALVDDPDEVLRRYADPDRVVPPGRVPALTAGMVSALSERSPSRLPDFIRCLSGAAVPADDAMVLDLPWLAQVLTPGELVAGGHDPAAVAAVFDLPVASEVVHAEHLVPVTAKPLPDAQKAADVTVNFKLNDALRAWEALGGNSTRASWVSCVVTPDLTVDFEGASYRVSWWIRGEERWVDGSAAGWGRLLAHELGRWELRSLASALLRSDSADAAEFGLD